MSSEINPDAQVQQMRARFEAGLPSRLVRASRVNLQQIIPAHWFAAAASECASMYVAGFFYGAISIAQAYVEALSAFLAQHHPVGVPKDPPLRWKKLCLKRVVSAQALDAALRVLTDRNDFHHLNREVEQEFQKLEARAEDCVNCLQIIESEVFAYWVDEPGRIALQTPKYWPSGGTGLAQVNLRKLW